MNLKVSFIARPARRKLWDCRQRTALPGLGFCIAVAWGALAPEVAVRAEDAPAKVTYADHVQPIFRQYCFACHSTEKKKSDLALDSYPSAIMGGASGEVLAAGDPSSSRLWLMVNHEEEPAMPQNADKLPDAQLAIIKAWIEGGLLEKGDSQARPSKKPAVAAFTPAADNRPAGEPAMPTGISREPVLHAPRAGAPTALATSPWAPLAAVGTTYQIMLYRTDTGELAGILPFLEGTPNVLTFSRDGSILLAGGGRAAARGVADLFDVKSGRRLATLGDELDAVLAADLSPDHSLVAIGGPRKVVRVYRVADASLAYEITKHTDWVTAMEFSPDGKYLATADRSGGLLLWDAATGRERGDLRGHAEQINAVSWRGDSAVLASASEDDSVRLWQTDGQTIKSWAAHGGGVASVQFSRDGQLVTAGRDRLVKTWQGDGAAIRDVATLDDIALSARFAHDGQRIVADDWSGNVRVFDAASGNQAAALDANPPTIAMRLAAAETQIAQLRTSASQAQEQLSAVQQQVAAAEKALEQARADVVGKADANAQFTAQLNEAEKQLAGFAAEKLSLEQSGEKMLQQKAAAQQELAAAEAAAAAVHAACNEEQVKVAQQQAVVDDLTSQLAALQNLLNEAAAALKPLADGFAAKQQEAGAADAKVEELKAAIDEVDRQRSEVDAIRTLREHYGAKP